MSAAENEIPKGESEDEEVAEPLDVFNLKWMPPEDSFVIQARFVDAGMGEPARYDFSDLFDDEEGGEEQSSKKGARNQRGEL